ncbi:MAG: hypothetical protein WD689_07645 [Gaiellaceae bacterium]
MEVEFVPEPTPQEREALLAARADQESSRELLSPWRRAALDPEDGEDAR